LSLTDAVCFAFAIPTVLFVTAFAIAFGWDAGRTAADHVFWGDSDD
jgi:hypothetical protein